MSKNRISEKSVEVCQSAIRGFFTRKYIHEHKTAAIALQTATRSKFAVQRLQEEKKKAATRKRILTEILTTEKTYTDNLTTFCKVVIQPLLTSNIISHELAHIIFSNLDYKIVKIHQVLLESLEEKFQSWQASDKDYRFQVGDLFSGLVEEFKSYHHYITNYDKSILTLQETRNTNPKFEAFLKEAKNDPRCNLLGVMDYLIMPIQRLPRYEMLLNDLLKHTDQQSPDYPHIQEALTQVKEITAYINQLKKERDSVSRLETLETKLIGTHKPSSIFKEGRLVIKEGSLLQIDSTGKETPVYVFLFSDMLLASKEKQMRKNFFDKTLRYDHQKDFPFEELEVQDMNIRSDEKGILNDGCFKVFHKRRTSGGVIWKAKTPGEKKLWIEEIQKAINEWNAKNKKGTD